jgi:cyclin C
MIALAALYIICVVHAERYTDNSNNGTNVSGNTLGDDNSGGSNMIATHTHGNMHLHSQLNSMATKKTPSAEGHGINNRNMIQWFADLNVDIEEVRLYILSLSFHPHTVCFHSLLSRDAQGTG